jgi:hypothetical protein
MKAANFLLALLLVASVALAGCHEEAVAPRLPVLLVEGSWTGTLTNGDPPETAQVCKPRPAWTLSEKDELSLHQDNDTHDPLRTRKEIAKGAIVLWEIREDTPLRQGCSATGYTFLAPGEGHEIDIVDPHTNTTARIQLDRANDDKAETFLIDNISLEKADVHPLRSTNSGTGTYDERTIAMDYSLNATALHYGNIRSTQITWDEA